MPARRQKPSMLMFDMAIENFRLGRAKRSGHLIRIDVTVKVHLFDRTAFIIERLELSRSFDVFPVR